MAHVTRSHSLNDHNNIITVYFVTYLSYCGAFLLSLLFSLDFFAFYLERCCDVTVNKSYKAYKSRM